MYSQLHCRDTAAQLLLFSFCRVNRQEKSVSLSNMEEMSKYFLLFHS